jgi:hypothetical protein
MPSSTPPSQQVLSRISGWCGIQVHREGELTKVYLRDRLIARFPPNDTVEAVLCGSVRQQVLDGRDVLPDGMWLNGDDKTIIVDLTTERGLEEAIRMILNAYIVGQSPEARDWWMNQQHLEEDPTCAKLAEIVYQYRQAEGRATAR